MPMRKVYLVRYLSRFIAEIGSVTKVDKVFNWCLAGAALGYVYLDGVNQRDTAKTFTSAVYAVLWAACIFAGYYSIKTSVDLQREDFKEWESYEPLIPGFKPPRPARWPGICTALLIVLIATSSIGFSVGHVISTRKNPPSVDHPVVLYPWFRFSSYQSGERKGILMSLDARIFTKESGPSTYVPPIVTFFNLNLKAYMVLSADPETDSWYGCTIVSNIWQEWNSANTITMQLLFGPADRAIVDYIISTRNGAWRGVISSTSKLESHQVLDGTIQVGDQFVPLALTEDISDGGRNVKRTFTGVDFTKDTFIRLGIPVHRWREAELQRRCPGDYVVLGKTGSGYSVLTVPHFNK